MAVSGRSGSGATCHWKIHLHGMRYWHPRLNQLVGQKLIVRYDPKNLHKPIQVYTSKDAFLSEAGAISDVISGDINQSCESNCNRRIYLKSIPDQEALLNQISIDELSRHSSSSTACAKIRQCARLDAWRLVELRTRSNRTRMF